MSKRGGALLDLKGGLEGRGGSWCSGDGGKDGNFIACEGESEYIAAWDKKWEGIERRRKMRENKGGRKDI